MPTRFFLERVEPTLKAREGGYVNHPSDRGGETNHGITVGVARRYGYNGPMRDMPWSVAADIYERRYVTAPGFLLVAEINADIALELVDTGVNMGPTWPSVFLQQALNAFNRRGRDYADIRVDGDCGPATRRALQAFLQRRGALGVQVMLKALNVQQGARYFDITPANDQNEDFMFGWFAERVAI